MSSEQTESEKSVLLPNLLVDRVPYNWLSKSVSSQYEQGGGVSIGNMSMWLGEPGVEKEFEQLPRKEGRQGQPRERLQTNRRIFSKYFFKMYVSCVRR
uniref:Bm8547 n=1 Tax=Brugia malayi TaxID=6279 RepID=A0A1I9FZZ3_BRUMA|nr:Bm8547 [Brugia malayi]